MLPTLFPRRLTLKSKNKIKLRRPEVIPDLLVIKKTGSCVKSDGTDKEINHVRPIETIHGDAQCHGKFHTKRCYHESSVSHNYAVQQ